MSAHFVRNRDLPKLSVLGFLAAYALFTFLLTEDVANIFKTGFWTLSAGTGWAIGGILVMLVVTIVVAVRLGNLPTADLQTGGAILSMFTAAPLAAAAKFAPQPWDFLLNAFPYALALTLLYCAWKQEGSERENLRNLEEEVSSLRRGRDAQDAVVPGTVVPMNRNSSNPEATSTHDTVLLCAVAIGLVAFGALGSGLPKMMRLKGGKK